MASSGGGMVKKFSYVGTEHITLPLNSKNPLRMYLNIERLVRLIREKNISLIHARSRAPAWSAWYAAQKTGIPFVTTFHGIYNFNNRLKKHYNSIMTRGDRVIAVSNFTAEHITNNYHIPADKIITINRGVDLEYFDPRVVSGHRIADLAAKWRIPDDGPLIVAPGRIVRWKGQIQLVNALAKIKDNTPFFCVLVGNETAHRKYTKELEALILKVGLGDRVRLVGDCQDMPAAFMLADVVVCPSIEPEAFGRVAVEAQAMAKPVIAYDHGGFSETVIHGSTGWLVEKGSEDGLAVAIKEALDMPKEAMEEIANSSERNAYQNYSINKMCDAELAIYDELLNRRR